MKVDLMTKDEVRVELKRYGVNHPELRQDWESLVYCASVYDGMQDRTGCFTTHWSLLGRSEGGDGEGNHGRVS
jgi:hypothetical protein